jgi:GDP-L-fucose synthase
VGFGSDITIGDLAQTIGEIVGFKGNIVFDASKPNGTPKKLMDSGRLFATGWKPQTALNDGIRLAYADFLSKHS